MSECFETFIFFLCSPFDEVLRHLLQVCVESYAEEALLKQDILVKLFTCHVLKHQIRKPDYLMIGLHSFVIMNYVFSYIFVRLQKYSQKIVFLEI